MALTISTNAAAIAPVHAAAAPAPGAGATEARPSSSEDSGAPGEDIAAASVAGGDQRVEDLAVRGGLQGEVTMLGADVTARSGNVRRQPLAVCERHEAVIAALPDRNRTGDRPDVEAPGA